MGKHIVFDNDKTWRQFDKLRRREGYTTGKAAFLALMEYALSRGTIPSLQADSDENRVRLLRVTRNGLRCVRRKHI